MAHGNRMKDLASREAARPVTLTGLDTWDLACLYSLLAEVSEKLDLLGLSDEDRAHYVEVMDKLAGNQVVIEFGRVN